MPNSKIALVTERRYIDQEITDENWYLKNIFHEDVLLSTALSRFGFQTQRLDWCDSEVDWTEYRAIVIRTTWDYFHRYTEFTDWLDQRKTDSTILNAPKQLQWNMDKHYLHDLQARQIAIVPTWYLEKGIPYDIDALFAKLGCEEAVLKPCVSGAARQTYRLRLEDRQAWERHLAELIPQESMLVQPFQRRIVEEGEITLVAFDGKVTHAVRKVAKAGDFRVQDDHGGTVYPHQPTDDEIAFAERAMRACWPIPVYGRVDIVRSDSGEIQLMELELVEPELWMRFAPESADRFAEAVVHRLANKSFNR